MASTPQVPLRVREQDLTGKVAVITGASRGIGRAIATNLSLRGCQILGTCSSTKSIHLIDSLETGIQQLYKTSDHKAPRIVGIEADILSPTCAQTIADAVVKNFDGRVDIFVNNAAAASANVFGEITLEEINIATTGNITTPLLIVEEFVKRKLFQPDGRIIYISSVRVRKPNDFLPLYAATKAAGETLCRMWSQAFGGKNEKVCFGLA